MTTETISDGKHELEEVISKLQKGEYEPQSAQAACERMDRMREETKRKVGMVEFAVEAIREIRDR